MRRILVLSLTVFLALPPSPVFSKGKERPEIQWEQRSTRAMKWFLEDLPRHLGGDLKETFWNGWHFLLLTEGVLATAMIHESDPNIQEAFQPERPLGKTVDDVLKIGAHPLVLGGISLLALGIFDLADAPKAKITAGTMLEALFLTEVMTLGLQFATQRGRPDGSNNHSFPSGHTSGAFAMATVAEVLHGPWVGIPSYLLASLVGLTRIDSNRHVASDVVAGAFLGTLIGLGTAKFHKKEFQNLFLVPTADNGSVGISAVRLF